MKDTLQAIFLYNNKLVGFVGKIKGEYVMQFIKDTPHL